MSPSARRVVVRLAAAVLVSGVLAGCGVRPESSARPLGGEQVPAGVLTSPSGAPSPLGPRRETLLLVRDTELVPVHRQTEDLSPRGVLRDLLRGPLPEERAAGLGTALPSTVGPLRVDVQDGTAVVDVPGGLLDSGRSDQVLALAQVVLTLDALPEVTGVRFAQAGQPLPVPRADGAVVQGPLTPADYQALLAGS